MGIRGPLEGLNRSGFRILEHGQLAALSPAASCSCLCCLSSGDLVDLAEAKPSSTVHIAVQEDETCLQEWYGDHNVPWYFEMVWGTGAEGPGFEPIARPLPEAQFYSFASFRSFALSEFGQRALGTLLWLAAQARLPQASTLCPQCSGSQSQFSFPVFAVSCRSAWCRKTPPRPNRCFGRRASTWSKVVSQQHSRIF